ncbi:MAG: DMT family transporter [Ignavibacteria bacterium]|nr:DMT family transporter [Ignavibacteria bacterium]
MKSNLLLLITAIIWGFGFVAQRSAMEYVGPFTFNTIRFALGGISLIPLLLINKRKEFSQERILTNSSNKFMLKTGIITGTILFFGASFQQSGIVYTTAGKAGFITGLYIVIVPIIGIAFNQKTTTATWLGAIIAVVGLYLLSIQDDFSISLGDFLVLISAVFWSLHVLVISKFSPMTDPIQLAFFQFMLCSVLSFITAIITEASTMQSIYNALVPILYAGVVSVGIAYTLQVVAQQDAHPSNAAIIMSLESVFAVLGGWLLLNESIPLRGLIGCGLMLFGMFLSQLKLNNKINVNQLVNKKGDT